MKNKIEIREFNKLKKHIENHIKNLKNKTMDIFNPNMMSDLERLLFEKNRLDYLIKNFKQGDSKK